MSVDYNTALRKLGYVDSGRSGSRGDYFISSYRPGSRAKRKLPSGLVEVHSCHSMNHFEIHTNVGVFQDLDKAISALTLKVE